MYRHDDQTTSQEERRLKWFTNFKRHRKDVKDVNMSRKIVSKMFLGSEELHGCLGSSQRNQRSWVVPTYLALSTGGVVGTGEVFSSPGCSGIKGSAGDPGGWALGGVEEAFRARVDAPFPFTQDVSITLTPILLTDGETEETRKWDSLTGVHGIIQILGDYMDTVPLYFPNAAPSMTEEIKVNMTNAMHFNTTAMGSALLSDVTINSTHDATMML